MKKDFEVVVLTPRGKYLAMHADYMSVKASSGVLGILPNHAPLISKVEISKLVIKNGQQVLKYAVSGGLINIKPGTKVVLMVDAIEKSDEIDFARATASKERAKARLSSDEKIDVERARASLARALNRLSIREE